MNKKQHKEQGTTSEESSHSDRQIAPEYPPDNGPLTGAQRQEIQKMADEEFLKNPFGALVSKSQLFQK